jgi:hypothetical protein
VKALALPAGFLASNSSKGGRLAVVVAAGAASPGESDDGLPSEDCEVTRSGLLCLFACMQLLLFLCVSFLSDRIKSNTCLFI